MHQSSSSYIKRAIAINLICVVKYIVMVLLAAFYLVGNAPFEAFHKIIHPQEGIVDHTIAQEENSCHRAVYHHEKEKGCAHKSHVTKLEKCKLCHALSHSDHIASFSSTCEFIQIDIGSIVKPIAALAIRIDSNLPSRAPPEA